MTSGPTVVRLERGGAALATDVVGRIPETTLVVCVELAQLLQELRSFQDRSCKPQSTAEADRSAGQCKRFSMRRKPTPFVAFASFTLSREVFLKVLFCKASKSHKFDSFGLYAKHDAQF